MSASPGADAAADAAASIVALPSPAVVAASSPLSMLLPETLARELGVVPLCLDGDRLQLACRHTEDLLLRDRLMRHLRAGLSLTLQAVDETMLQQLLDRCYGIGRELAGVLSRYPANGAADNAASPPAAALLELLVRDALRHRASDLHLRTSRHTVQVGYRIDGLMVQAHRLPAACAASLLVRVKVAGGLDIAESRLPQDGQGDCRVHGQSIHFRVSTMPAHQGETAVLRLFDPVATSLRLEDLQPSTHMRRRLSALTSPIGGLVLVVGPTGCGKSTTLHALVGEIDAGTSNILTLEDPVEIPVPGWQQCAIDAARGFDFATGIRSALRQDPDVLLIGEIRDTESAAMALRASLTGHRVYTSLHAEDAIGALSRLVDLGIARHDLAACVDAIVAQRLLRRRCRACDGVDPGCPDCAGRGSAGRVAAMEILRLDDTLRDALRSSDFPAGFRRRVDKAGFADMATHAARLCDEGIVSRTEVMRVFGQGRGRRLTTG